MGVLAILVASSIQAERRLGMTSGQKTILKNALKAGVDLARTCGVAEIDKKLDAFPLLKKIPGMSGAKIGEAMANLANKVIDTLIGSRRRMFGLSDLAKGVAAIGAKVKSANTALAKATGINVANI